MEPLNTIGLPLAPALSSASDSSSPLQASTGPRRTKKEATTPVVACRQCRLRKVRCDSGRPVCKNCTRRCDTCEYDTAPKRRGPDKLPGARTRSYKKKPEDVDHPSKRSKGANEAESSSAEGRASKTIKTSVDKNKATPESGVLNGIVGSTPVALQGVTGSVPSQAPQILAPLFSRGTMDDEEYNDTLHAAGFVSVERFLRQEESAFGNQLAQLPSNFVTSVDQVPQIWSQNIPTSAYQYGHAYKSNTTGPLEFSSGHYIPRGPSVSFYKQTWWDSLLPLYSPDPSQSALRIYQDLNFLLNNAIYWFSFINTPLLMNNLFDSQRRVFMQPSVVLSALALATLMKSSETGLGEEGRGFAIWLRDAAQSSLEASLNASWIEPSLAQAAFFLVVFESSAHPNHTSARAASAIYLLDSLLQALSLTRMDAYEPDVSIFPADDVPVGSGLHKGYIAPPAPPQNSSDQLPFVGGMGLEYSTCGCMTHKGAPTPEKKWSWVNDHAGALIRDARELAIQDNFAMQAGLNAAFAKPGSSSRDAVDETVFSSNGTKLTAVGWPESHNPSEVQKEESRRLCWASMVLVSALGEYSPHFAQYANNLYITRHENFALYYPGEAQIRNGAKESIWSLHCRAALLWNACQRLRSRPDWHQRRLEFTSKAWLEANEIENSLRQHTCPLGKGVLFAGREYLFKLKMLVSNDFTRLIPLPHTLTFERNSAQEWLDHRDVLATHVRKLVYFVNRFGANACSLALAKRPMTVWWAMYQIQTGSLVYKSDPTMVLALKQSLDFLAMVDFLTTMWPSEQQTQYYGRLRKELLQNCAEAGVVVPAPVPIRGLPAAANGSMIPSPFFANKASHEDILMAPLD